MKKIPEKIFTFLCFCSTHTRIIREIFARKKIKNCRSVVLLGLCNLAMNHDSIHPVYSDCSVETRGFFAGILCKVFIKLCSN